jgi:protein-S-isoprenylcysteine O-methyltransferase Ste14
MFGGSAVLWVLVEYGLRVRGDLDDQTSADWSAVLILVAIPVIELGAIFAVIDNVAPLPGAPWWPVILGLTLIWIGMGLRIWAALTLNQASSTDRLSQLSAKRRLYVVDHGPYRQLRHPGYLGALAGFAGLGIAGGYWASAIIMMVGTFTVFLIRIRVEEKELLQMLGEEYACYMRHTARLFPGVF